MGKDENSGTAVTEPFGGMNDENIHTVVAQFASIFPG